MDSENKKIENPKNFFVKMEEELLDSWDQNNIFQKSIDQREKASNFVFYEGPPTANGRPGIHHVISRSIKDAFCRYKTMRGFHVIRKAGWDTQGIPVELEVEKELGFKNKQDIEKYGVVPFINKCKESVWKYLGEWEKITKRMGYWVDIKHPYITYENNYIESLWWIIKQIWDRGLFYQGYKIVPYCPRCGTSLSSHEVAQGYKLVKEPSIYVKFKLKKQDADLPTYFLVWTTTPWTLPANVAVAVNSELEYVKIKYNNEILILAKDRLSIVEGEFQVIEEFFGKDLTGVEYEPIFDFAKPDKNAYFAIVGSFVTAVDGTGIVHIAPAFGEDDMEVGKANDLPVLMTLDENGKFIAGPWMGMAAKDTDPKIIENLKEKNILWKVEDYEHEYPFCWRCHSALLYYATTSWFINMKSVQADLIKNNEMVNWVPAHLKEGRFGEWIKGVKDWAFSRQRYWGTPLPIWICDKCKEKIVVGSFEELETLGGKMPINEKGEPDIHRPYVDAIKLKCPKCQGEATRIPDVADVWFDSGSMPFAQYHYPFENKELQEQQYPADFIAEAMDQTRGWFYVLLAIATLLQKETPYKNVVCNGMILDEKGKKMSKSLGNIVVPQSIIDKYGVDALRFHLLASPLVEGGNLLFSEKSVDEIYKKVLLILSNIYQLYRTYKTIDTIPAEKDILEVARGTGALDQWLLSKMNLLIKETTDNLDKYNTIKSLKLIYDFINEFSTWYVRLSRERFKKGSQEEKDATSQVFGYCLMQLIKIMAPFTPFVADYIYQGIGGKKESVHLEDWPAQDNLMVDYDVLKKMEATQKAVEIGLALRATANMKIRQPLNKIVLKDKEMVELLYSDLVKQELNVKNVELGTEDALDLVISDELKLEGLVRELTRSINQLRKDSELTISDTNVKLEYETTSELLKEAIDKNKEEIKKGCLCGEIAESSFEAKEVSINGEKIKMRLSK